MEEGEGLSSVGNMHMMSLKMIADARISLFDEQDFLFWTKWCCTSQYTFLMHSFNNFTVNVFAYP
jgi:hypothetical protein